MPGFNGGTIPKSLLAELYTPDMRLELADFFYNKLPLKTVPQMNGTTAVMPLSMSRGTANISSTRDLEVAPGAPTPKANFAMGERAYRMAKYKEAVGIDDISDLEAQEFTSELKSIMEGNIGLSVAGKQELVLAAILAGLGTAEDGHDVLIEVLADGDRFDVYGTDGEGYSDVFATVEELIKLTGGRNVAVSDDVWRALARHPQFTNKYTGTGREILGDSGVEAGLRDAGLSGQIIHLRHEYSNRARELGYNRQEFFQNTFAVFSDGGIHKLALRGKPADVAFDSFEDEDTEMLYLRASKVGGIWIPVKEQVVILQNILTP